MLQCWCCAGSPLPWACCCWRWPWLELCCRYWLVDQRTQQPPRPEARWRWVQVSLLAACALVQGLTLLTTAGARLNTVLGADASKFARIVAGQIALPLFQGSNHLDQWPSIPRRSQSWLCVITILTLAVYLYALLEGSPEIRCFVFFALLVLAAALTFPTVEPIPYQWDAFLVPGQGVRYWYIPKLALMATLIWMLGRPRPVTIRALAGVLACVMAFSAVKHWRYPRVSRFLFRDLRAEV